MVFLASILVVVDPVILRCVDAAIVFNPVTKTQGIYTNSSSAQISLTLTCNSTPTQYNVMVLGVEVYEMVVGTPWLNYVVSVTQSGVTWTQAISDHAYAGANYYISGDIWYGQVTSSSASKSLTITVYNYDDGTAIYGAVAEYSGINYTSPLDKVASNSSDASGSYNWGANPLETGTTSLTSFNSELWFAVLAKGGAMGTPTVNNGFSMLTTSQTPAVADKLVSSTGNATAGFTVSSPSYPSVGLIATFKAAVVAQTISADTIVANENFTLSTTINDPARTIYNYTYSTNNTGTWVNATTVTYMSNPATYNGTWNNTVGVTVSSRLYFHDSLGEWASDIYNFTLTDAAPSYTQYSALPIQQNYPCNFSCKWIDNLGLSGWIFEENTTGVAINSSWVAFTGNPDWANITKTLPNINGSKVVFQWYANDSQNNWGATGEIVLIVTNEVVPSYTNITYSTTTGGAACTFTVQWQGVNGLSGYIFSSNSTGVWLNYTYAILYNNPDFAITLASLPSTNGVVVGFRWYCNDTDGNWGDTGIQTLTVVSAGGGGGSSSNFYLQPNEGVDSGSSGVPAQPKMDNFVFTVGIVGIILIGAAAFFGKNAKKTVKQSFGEWK